MLANGVVWGTSRRAADGESRRLVDARARRPTDAVAISDGRITAVGTVDDARAAVAPAQEIDLAGATVLPGFVDSHLHIVNWGRGRLGVPCWPEDVSSVAEIVSRVQSVGVDLPAGGCLRGRGFDPSQLAEARSPTAHELDLGRDRLVVLDSMDFHRRVVNTEVLAKAGIGPSTVDPPGGVIVRDASSAPTGELLDSARALVDHVIPPWSEGDNDEAVRVAARHFVRQGFTGLTNAAPLTMSATGEEIAAFGRLAMRDELPLRIRSMVKAEAGGAVLELGLPDGLAFGRLTVAGLKIFADGAFGPRTAWLAEPYEDVDTTGGLSADTRTFESMLRHGAATGWQICVHAIGDQAVSLTAALLASLGSGAVGHRIEHCCLTDAETVGVMASSGLIPVPQLGFLRERADDFLSALGAARMHRLYPLRDWIDAGIHPVHGSDAPVTRDTRPLVALATAVTRTDSSGRSWGSDQAISAEQAIAMLTSWPALADGAADRGRIEVGCRADLTVLDKDPRAVPPESWCELQPVMTIVDGSVAWSR